MPFAAKKPCPHPGCGKAIGRTDRYCEAHRKAYTSRINRERSADPVKRARDAFYDTKAWREARLVYLADHPLCVDCEARGLIVSATQVDHIQSIASGGAALDSDNFQSLCQRCHSKKTRRDGGTSW